MNTNDNNSSKKVLDLKPLSRNGGRLPHSKIAQFTPDEDLIQSTSRIKNQRDIILERVHRMETSEERVSQNVYQKVKRDYSLQLETINELLNEKKEALKQEIKKLYMIREKLTVEVNRHREILEEADFRHYLGEFTQSQYQEVENFETKEIEKSEADLAHINQWIRTHEELLDPKDFGQRPPQQPAPEPKKTERHEATQTAYRPAPAPEKPVTSAETGSDAGAAEKKTSSDEEFAHLFDDSASSDEDIADGLKEDTTSNLDELIQEVQASVQQVEKAPQDSSAETKTEEAQQTSPATEEKPESPKEDSDYFENQNQEEQSFRISKDEIQNSPEDHSETSDDLPQGDSLTFAKTDLKPADKPTPDPQKEDSISDILDSIRLDGEDEAPSETAAPSNEAPKKKTDYKLTLTQGDLDTKEYPLQANTSIGRSPSNDVVLKEPKVSRQHAAINLYNGKYIMVDLKSSNGVYVNGSKIDETVLNAGDEISIGGYKFIFMKND